MSNSFNLFLSQTRENTITNMFDRKYFQQRKMFNTEKTIQIGYSSIDDKVVPEYDLVTRIRVKKKLFYSKLCCSKQHDYHLLINKTNIYILHNHQIPRCKVCS